MLGCHCDLSYGRVICDDASYDVGVAAEVVTSLKEAKYADM